MPGVVEFTVAVAKAIVVGSASSAIVGAVAALARVVLLSVIASKLFAQKLPPAAGLQGVQVTTRGTIDFRKIIIGQALVSGPINYNNLSGPNNEDLWYVVTMCDGLQDSLIEFRLDGDVIPAADIDWTPGTGASDGTGTGEVSTAKYIGENGEKALRIYYYLGDDAQPVCGPLNSAFTEIDTDFRGRGIAYAVFRMRYNVDTEQVWESGLPQDFMGLFKGRALYDWRKDGTNGGTGAHRYTDESTWEWSDNPDLALQFYLMKYLDVDPATSIAWGTDAADDTEALVEIPPVASPANTQKRFTCNGVLTLGDTHKDNLDAVISSMDGRLSYISGTWKTRASVWEVAAGSITEDDIAPVIELQGSAGLAERYNTVHPIFIDPARDYQGVEAQQVSRATYVTRDGGKSLHRDLSLPMTNDENMAQRIGFRVLDFGNNQKVMQTTMNERGADVAVGELRNVTVPEFSFSPQTMRCISWQPNQNGDYEVVLREDSSASYDDPLVADYAPFGGGTITVPADVVPPPDDLAATSRTSGIELNWTNPPAGRYDFINVYEADTDDWLDAVLVASIRADTIVLSRAPGTLYYYWIRAFKAPNLESIREPNTETSAVFGSAGAFGPVQAVGATLADISISPAQSEVAYRFNSDGKEQSYEGTGGSFADIGDWLLAGSVADYEVQMEDLGTGTNTPTGAAVDTWLDPTSSPALAWTLTDTAVSSPAAALTFFGKIRIRHAATQTEIVTAANNVLVSMSVEMSGDSVVVSADDGDVNRIAFQPGSSTCYAGVQYNSSGAEFSNVSGSSQVFSHSRGNWLDAGAAADVWVERTIITSPAPTLNWKDAGTGRLQLSTTREFGISQATTGPKTITVTFDFWDAASGGNLLDSVTITLTADLDPGI